MLNYWLGKHNTGTKEYSISGQTSVILCS